MSIQLDIELEKLKSKKIDPRELDDPQRRVGTLPAPPSLPPSAQYDAKPHQSESLSS